MALRHGVTLCLTGPRKYRINGLLAGTYYARRVRAMSWAEAVELM
jgi:hypothetical protein